MLPFKLKLFDFKQNVCLHFDSKIKIQNILMHLALVRCYVNKNKTLNFFKTRRLKKQKLCLSFIKSDISFYKI